jgi:DNA-binding transcriptional regulator YdaS (Cro superfamily)
MSKNAAALSPKKALTQAIKIAGGYRALARAIGTSHQTISKWRRRVPAERVLAVERATGISRRLLRPDVYPE